MNVVHDPSPMIESVHHSAYRCRDAEQTRWFYENVIGLPAWFDRKDSFDMHITPQRLAEWTARTRADKEAKFGVGALDLRGAAARLP